MSLDAHQRRLGALFDESYEYFQTRLPPHIRLMYVEEIQHLGFEEARAAFALYRRTPPPSNQTKKPPMPLDILQIANPRAMALDEANELSSRIWGAIGSLGYNKSSATVRAFIGEDAWDVVSQMGGNWRGLCESVNVRDQTHWMAQLRDKALAVISRRDQQMRHAALQPARQRDALHAARHAKQANPGLSPLCDVLSTLPIAHGR